MKVRKRIDESELTEEDRLLFIETACIQNILHYNQTCQPKHFKCQFYVHKETHTTTTKEIKTAKVHTRFTAFFDYPGLSIYRLSCDFTSRHSTAPQ